MESKQFKYHVSIYSWAAACLAFAVVTPKEGRVMWVIVGIILFGFTWFVRRSTHFTLNEKEFIAKKFASTIEIPYGQISSLEHQKSVFGSHGILLINLTSGKSVKLKRMPNLEALVAELKSKMGK